jgi:hypothetical protein
MAVVGRSSLVVGLGRNVPPAAAALQPQNNYCRFVSYKLWQHGSDGREKMARKKKAKRFSAVTAVKELARERVGAPPSGQVVREKKKKPEKHKPTLGKMLGETE